MNQLFFGREHESLGIKEKPLLENILTQHGLLIISCMIQDTHVAMRDNRVWSQETQLSSNLSALLFSKGLPLKIRLALQGLQKKIFVAVHVRTYLSTSAYPAAQSYACIRGPRLRRGTIVRGTITTMKENHRERPKQHKEPYLDIRDT